MTERCHGRALPRAWFLTAVLLLPLLAGCVPMKFSVYRVSGPGRVESGYCVAGLDDVLRIRAPRDVEIVVSAGRYAAGQPTQLSVRFYVPVAVSLRLTEPEVILESPEWPEVTRLVVSAIIGPGGDSRSGTEQHGPTEEFTGVTEKKFPGTVFIREAHLWFEPDKNLPLRAVVPPAARFTAALPPMEISGERFEAGPVTFIADSQWGIFSCLQ